MISCFSVQDPESPDVDRRNDSAAVSDPDEPRSPAGADSGAVAPGPQTDADDEVTQEVAQAEARAEAAKARLERLRRTAGATGDHQPVDAEQRPAKARKRLRLPPRPGRPGWLRRPGRRTLAVAAGVVLVSASAGASGYMLWQHRTQAHHRQLAAEFSAAARQGITALMTIDPEHAKEDVQRMIDASTGDLNNQLSAMSYLMVTKAQDSKIGNKVSVEAVAVQSLSDNSGVVLVAAKTNTTGPDNAKPPPALFRLSVTLDRDGGQLKMSRVDYLS